MEIRYLLYADDLVILSHSPRGLQLALNELHKYATENKLTISIQKTKCMVFYNGSCPTTVFYLDGQPLENCNEFTYLGVVFTTRLSSTKHIDHIVSKCNAKIGFLFSKLPLKEIPLSVAIDIFNVYVRPIATYCLPIWLSSMCAQAEQKLNSVFTKFLKRNATFYSPKLKF